MFISPKVVEAGKALTQGMGLYFLKSPVLVPAPLDAEYPEQEQSMRMLVATEIRKFLERKDIEFILAVLGSLESPWPYIIGGSETDTLFDMRYDYGFDTLGPFKEMFRVGESRSKYRPFCTERISPEELLAHIDRPEFFLKNIHHYLDVAAGKILKREQQKKRAVLDS